MEDFTLIGQPLAARLIRKMVKSGRLGGSYLFAGPRGVGKKTAAMFLAMAVNCREGGFPPCGRCPACKKILSRSHPDVLTLSPEEGKQTISIEQVRALREALAYAPYEGKRRVVILDPAERLGLESANALLLTLEAPPPHTLFVLVTSTMYALLRTIRSRCQIIRFSPLSKQSLVEIARRKGVSLIPDSPMLELCQGSATRLLTLQEPKIKGEFGKMDNLITAILTGSGSPGLIENPKWAKQRAAMEIFLERALWLTRDVMASLGSKTWRGVSDASTIERINSRLRQTARERLLDLMDTIFQLMEDLKYNAAPELIFDILRFEMEEISG